VRAPDDERQLQIAIAQVTIGDRRGLDTGLRGLDDPTPGSPAKAQLQPPPGAQPIPYGLGKYMGRDYAPAPLGLVRAHHVVPGEARAKPNVSRTLKDAEKHLARDRTYLRCRAAN